jgi:starch phosphorylase
VSLIDEPTTAQRRVRMAAWPSLASHKVNGVGAALAAVVETIFADYARLYPERFINITNGVTPRRWLMQANPGCRRCSTRRSARVGGAT